ncbi:MAG: hypothetical protein H0W78_14495 [Planctomycetes bacterium]|nr:hypothetical protein [Planctomycetota bacterium]
MSTNAAIDLDALYYLYVNNEWAGPYQVAQIRDQVKQETIDPAETYAYAAAHQQHYTVEALLAASAAAIATAPAQAPTHSAGTSSNTGKSSSVSFDDILDMAPQSAASFDTVLPDLKTLYGAYLGLTEHTAEPQQALKELHTAHQGLIQELDHRRSDINALSRIINEIDEVGDYLANRHQLTHIWQLLSEMEKVDLRTKADDGVSSARAVLASLVAQAETKAGSDSGNSSSVLLDLAGLDDEADSVITRKILLSARSEVASTKRDMDVLQQTYNELQDQHAKDLEKARKLLERAEAARAEERHTARQTAAEVRNLAAEIQRLASESDIAGGSDRELAEQVARLGEELKTADASTLAYIAEDVLIRMVAELRQLATTGSSGDIGPLRAELALARESLAQAQAQVAQLTSERDSLRLQYEQSRMTAEKASERAKDREHRLRSTVTAMEVTKELHMEVMEDLKSQLQTAQGRVEQMERDLASVRGEMKDSTGTVEARGKAIQHEMQRMVEMKAMLEVRSNELSENLKSAEDELAKAQSSQQDGTLAEALAAKVTQLRTTYEATTYRLREQEANAQRLAQDLEASRREAEELRGRGDLLSNELGEARGSLSAAKHRLDELHQAYARLETEREALHTELHHRKSTDTIHKQSGAEQYQTEHISRLEHESALLQRQLTAERRQAEQLAEARQNLENRISELLSEREDLRRKFENLQGEHFNDHARHTAAIAVSTQAAIESERRLRELQNRVAELDAQLTRARKGTDGESLEPTTARIANQSNALESVEQESLRAELEQVARERDRVLAELETIRTSTTTRSAAVPEHVAKRLSDIERELTAAKTEIAALSERHAQAVAERDRLRREAERFKGELESAAVEHRTALKSARDRLAESQARVAVLERQLSDHAAGERDGQVLRGHLDHSLVEQERLSHEVQRLAAELARLNATVPADRDQQIIGLAKASQQLAGEQEKVLVLTRSLMETLQQADSARGRTLELQETLDQRTSERDRLQQELDHQRAELTNLRLSGGPNRLPFTDLQPTLEKRDQIIAELEEVRLELAETRARLNESTRVIKTLESLGGEKNRIKSLEAELEKLRSESEQRQQMFNEARARLVQVSSERDRLAAELAELKSRPDQSVELKMLRNRLIRAKRMIKRLRRERDDAIADRMKSATNLHQLTGQLERLKSAQRAAAEALGLPTSGWPPDLPPVPVPSAVAAATREFHPTDLSGGRVGVGAARPLPASGDGLVSSFGRPLVMSPTVNSAAANYGNVPAFTSRHGSPSVGQLSHPATVRAKAVHAGSRSRRLLLGGTIAGGLALGVFVWGVALPAMFPLSTNAVVNSKVALTRAPIEGMVKGLAIQPGETVGNGQLLTGLRNDRLDLGQLKAMTEEAQAATARLAALGRTSGQLQQDQALLNQALATWRTERVRTLKAGLEAAKAAEADARKAMDDADARLHGLRLAGVPVADLAEPAIAYERTKRQVAAAARTITELDAAIAAIGAGERDSEWEQHARQQELARTLTDTLTETRRLEQTLAETTTRIAAEQARIDHLRAAEVSAESGGRMLRLYTADGRWLRQGDPIAAVADPTSLVIDCVLPDRHVDDIALGSEIIAYLITDRREVRGRVIAKIAPGTTTADGDWAEDFAGKHRFRTVARIGLEGVSLDTIQISQGVRVMFLGSNPGLITRGLAEMAQVGRF